MSLKLNKALSKTLVKLTVVYNYVNILINNLIIKYTLKKNMYTKGTDAA